MVFLIHTSFSVGKLVFGLVRNAKSADFPEGNLKSLVPSNYVKIVHWQSQTARSDKKDISWSKMLGERLFFDICSPPNPTFGSKSTGYLSWMTVVTIFGVSS